MVRSLPTGGAGIVSNRPVVLISLRHSSNASGSALQLGGVGAPISMAFRSDGALTAYWRRRDRLEPAGGVDQLAPFLERLGLRAPTGRGGCTHLDGLPI